MTFLQVASPLAFASLALFGKVRCHQSSNDDNADHNAGSLFPEDSRPYRVVPALVAKFPTTLLSGPFLETEYLYCHPNKASCASGEGVDHLFTRRRLWCDIDEDKQSEDVIRVFCDNGKDDDESIMTIPTQCCERILEGDTSIYSTLRESIHYTGWEENARSLVLAMDLLERTYWPQLSARKREGVQPILLFSQSLDASNNGEERNVPVRVQKSTLYKHPLPRLLPRQASDYLDDKWKLAKRIEHLGLNTKHGPFPVMYLSCEKALKAVKDPDAQFHIVTVPQFPHGKSSDLKVSRSELQDRMNGNKCMNDESLKSQVIHQVVTNRALIGKYSFHIRVFVLVHAGRVHMHRNAVVTWQMGDSTTTDSRYAFISDTNSTKREKEWFDAVYNQLVTALPVMEPIVNATSTKEGTGLYNIYGVKAMVRTDGKATLLEMSSMPNMEWMGGRVTQLDDDGQESTPGRQSDGRSAHEEWISKIYADFFAMVLGLDYDSSNNDHDGDQTCHHEIAVREVRPLGWKDYFHGLLGLLKRLST